MENGEEEEEATLLCHMLHTVQTQRKKERKDKIPLPSIQSYHTSHPTRHTKHETRQKTRRGEENLPSENNPTISFFNLQSSQHHLSFTKIHDKIFQHSGQKSKCPKNYMKIHAKNRNTSATWFSPPLFLFLWSWFFWTLTQFKTQFEMNTRNQSVKISFEYFCL